jgi:hypothetical protein
MLSSARKTKQTTIKTLENYTALLVWWSRPGFDLGFRRLCRSASPSRVHNILPSRGVQSNSCQSAMSAYLCFEAKVKWQRMDRPRK